MIFMSQTLRIFLITMFSLCPLWTGILFAEEPLFAGRNNIINKYRGLETILKTSPFGIPIYLESSVDSNASLVDIYGTVEYPFSLVQNELRVPANWCEIVLLHIDVRACVHERVNNISQLTIYNVYKANEPLQKADLIKYEYHANESQSQYLNISLTAREGPFKTKDHRFVLEAAPVNKDTTFIHLRYSYDYSPLGYFLMNSYLSIFDPGKIGFSVTGANNEGNPVYVGGLRGVAERNVVRYYLAILAYLNTSRIPHEQRFEASLNEWYNLTSRYRRQLFRMEKDEYLLYKRRDERDQQKLQNDLIKMRIQMPQ